MIIGLAGDKGAGKTAIAGAIASTRRQTFVMSFTSPIKEMLMVLLQNTTVPDPHAHLYGRLKEEPIAELGGKSARWAMQTLGTEWGRNMIDRDLWINITMNQVERLHGGSATLVIIDDVRFIGEANAIRDAGGRIFNILRAGTAKDDAHSSETGIRAPHVSNSGTPNDAAQLIMKDLGYD